MARRYRSHTQLSRFLAETGRGLARCDIDKSFGIHALEACLATGTVLRVLPGIYIAPERRRDPHTRLSAVAAWIGDSGALTGNAALFLYGFASAPHTIRAQVPVQFKRSTPPGIKLLRSVAMPRVRLVRGVRVVALAAAIVQAWNELSGDRAVGTVVHATIKGRVRTSDLLAVIAATPRVRKRAELVTLAQVLNGGITSFLEHRAHSRVFPPQIFPELRWQHHVVALGRDRYLDAYDPLSRLAIEFDGEGFHSGEEARQRDSERDAGIATLDIEELHFTYRDLMDRVQWCRDVYVRVREVRLSRSSSQPSREMGVGT